jgi:hypothetical protein
MAVFYTHREVVSSGPTLISPTTTSKASYKTFRAPMVQKQRLPVLGRIGVDEIMTFKAVFTFVHTPLFRLVEEHN